LAERWESAAATCRLVSSSEAVLKIKIIRKIEKEKITLKHELKHQQVVHLRQD